ncbi:hypothetical protein KOW79_009731 [Hemibagrus wyckioides]|uniref:Uncharacterized protein n=1 Tax=Hemibagrus wyckioides TaxID=337641 RepID=A0A9D3SJU2_9TELE|nr:hypothetical protein KOW79_009731 [Hemibagrus wyckioides]
MKLPGKMPAVGKKSEAGSPGVVGWMSSAYRFATDRNDFRRNLLVNLGFHIVPVKSWGFAGGEDQFLLSMNGAFYQRQ